MLCALRPSNRSCFPRYGRLFCFRSDTLTPRLRCRDRERQRERGKGKKCISVGRNLTIPPLNFVIHSPIWGFRCSRRPSLASRALFRRMRLDQNQINYRSVFGMRERRSSNVRAKRRRDPFDSAKRKRTVAKEAEAAREQDELGE